MIAKNFIFLTFPQKSKNFFCRLPLLESELISVKSKLLLQAKIGVLQRNVTLREPVIFTFPFMEHSSRLVGWKLEYYDTNTIIFFKKNNLYLTIRSKNNGPKVFNDVFPRDQPPTGSFGAVVPAEVVVLPTGALALQADVGPAALMEQPVHPSGPVVEVFAVDLERKGKQFYKRMYVLHCVILRNRAKN